MGILDSVRAALEPSDRETPAPIAGAYWCDDCAVRIPLESRPDGNEQRPCPDCDEPMQFELSPDGGSCAC
ncbi:hypothetical protein [Natrialbaceae archaeon AArc-T1-2]|uniref:hypothetical protein n=1 Tax=Natrialbaceae archaeon AArc-T1-2 TaxID=3053904 RepID=UPI00255A9603|nr:hypothetical protein [Natrialbaceae archaeon AArc-T1-2]WIV68128.1 hypothetical protein QQ977_05205 [Natrialbaceae archaeon AArc-T1-2]